MKTGPTPKPVRDRFEGKYQIVEPGGCWVWMGATDRHGYGCMGVGSVTDSTRRTEKAHRVSWLLAYGFIPEGKCVLHSCDVPSCVRPDHLWLGSKADNSADMAKKGRSTIGETNPRAKLTTADVSEMRALDGTMTRRAIGERYGVSDGHVCNILNGKCWNTGEAK